MSLSPEQIPPWFVQRVGQRAAHEMNRVEPLRSKRDLMTLDDRVLLWIAVGLSALNMALLLATLICSAYVAWVVHSALEALRQFS